MLLVSLTPARADLFFSIVHVPIQEEAKENAAGEKVVLGGMDAAHSQA